MKIHELNGKTVNVIYEHLRKFAFNIDKSELQKALLEMEKDIKRVKANRGEPYRQGWFFRTLLFRLNRFIDWRLAEELENEFGKRY